MKQPLITIAAVVLVGCGESQESTPVSKTVLSKPSSLSKEDSYRLSASEIEEISSKPHDPIWTVPKLSRLAFRPGSWERHGNGRTQFKKMKYVGGNNVVIETSLTYNSPKIATEIHSFDLTSNTMYSNVLIHPTREIRRATGVVNIEERSVNWTSKFDSNESEKLILKLKLKFENDGRGATLNGNRSKNGVLISQINAKLKWVADLPSSSNTEPKQLKN